MAKKSRSILIQIPEELKLTQNEIDSLEHAFMAQLAVVEAPGDVEVPVAPINTTRLPVEITVVGSARRDAVKDQARKSSKKTAKKSAKKATKKTAKKKGKSKK